MRALIIDEARDRSAVAAARALAGGGWTVDSGACVPSVASRSNSVSGFHRIPHTDDGKDAFLRGAIRVLDEGGYDLVFALWDTALLQLSEAREQLPAIFPYADHQTVLRGSDKAAVNAAAERVGIATPHTITATDDALESWSGPVVIKPVSHAPAHFEAQRFANGRDAMPRADEIRDAGDTPLAQEVVDGSLMAFAAVADRNHKLVSVSQQVAEQIWPTGTGITARGVTIPVDHDLSERAEALLAELGWFGLVQLQFLVPRDNVPRLIDFNARFYGSLALAVRAGANHPLTWAELAVGRRVQPSTAAPGVRFQWFTRDLRASLSGSHRLREITRALTVAPTSAHSLWSPREPALAPRFLAEQSGRAIKRRVGPFTSRET